MHAADRFTDDEMKELMTDVVDSASTSSWSCAVRTARISLTISNAATTGD
jgi:hypothetical protein